MKIKSFLAIAAGSILLTACQGNDAKSLADIKDATAGDSLVYYFGQLRGAEYKREATADTTLLSQSAKDSYIKGVQAGLNLSRNDDEAFNNGVFLGLQMAINIRQFKTDYDVQLDKKVFIESLAQAINSDSIANTSELQSEFYRIMNDFSTKKDARDKEAAQITLSKEAAKLKMKKITDEVFGGPTDKKDGALLKQGDDVIATAKLSDLQGNSFDVPLPTSIKIGARNIPQPVSDALKTLRSGESGKFLTSAYALFGQRVAQLGLKPDEILVMNLTAALDNSVKSEEAN